MFAGIFAAGEGTRLSKAYPGIAKPMVKVSGRPLAEWAVRLLVRSGYRDITILLSSRSAMVRKHLESVFPGKCPFIRYIIQDTSSSWESFRLVAKALGTRSDSFLMSTVDAFYDPKVLKNFTFSPVLKYSDAVLGITDAVADEKPLWADLDESGRIVAMGKDCLLKKYATNGIYWINRALAGEMPANGRYTALREYLVEQVKAGRRIWSWLMPKSVDVDDPSDVALAEEFVRKHLTPTLPGACSAGPRGRG